MRLDFFSAEGTANSLAEFKYDPERGDTFPAYYRRFETIFTKRCEKWSDEEKITLLLQKLGTEENTKFTNLILPKKPEDISFSETVEILCSIFGERDSLFHTRYKCLNMQKEETDDIVTYAGKVNAQCELFKLKDLSVDTFKFICPGTDSTEGQGFEVKNFINYGARSRNELAKSDRRMSEVDKCEKGHH